MWWPLCFSGVLLIVSIVFMFRFARPIERFIDRVKAGKLRGFELQAAIERVGQEQAETNPVNAEVIARALDSPPFRSTQEAIVKNLETRGIRDPNEKVQMLVRELAAAQLALAFEHIHSLIWGSQVQILEHLNSSRAGLLKGSLKATFYDPAAAEYRATFEQYPYEQYLGFLKNFGLITEEADRLVITAFGVEFLRYLAATGKSIARQRVG